MDSRPEQRGAERQIVRTALTPARFPMNHTRFQLGLRLGKVLRPPSIGIAADLAVVKSYGGTRQMLRNLLRR